MEHYSKGKLLSKAPCNEDLFEGGAHKKLAKEISDEIRNDDKCTIIGIDGGWGSGKSNLVGMIQKELSSEANGRKFHFFTYDAWGHQSDPQRRTILEELTSDLVKGNTPILDENSWKDSLEDLLAKKKYTNTKTIPAIGVGSIVSLFSILLTPFVTHLASLVSIEYLKQAILIVPYLAAYWFYGHRHYVKMKEKYGQIFTWEKCISEFFLIYKDNIKEETKFETISEREPSSRQFKNWIHEIDKGLKQHHDIILILVIDNMDRLPKLKVQELWAAIHSCFSEEKYSNIRIIVPFDRLHIRNAFQSENIIKQGEGQNQGITVYGDDFINKTFYVVYTVPPPILSGWMHYFKDRWKEAFGKDANVDYSVLQIYDMLTKEQSPRKIIAFINQFVTLRNLSDEKIEDKYIALYIFGRNKIVENPLEEILTPSYLGSLKFMYFDDNHMQECISSLYYQLPLNTAMDVVFTREVTAELNDNDIKILDQLKDSSNYWEILNHSITNVNNIENAALALEKHFDGNDSVESKQIWDALYRRSSPGCATDDMEFKEYHYVLLKHISDKINFYHHLLTVYHVNLSDTSDILNYINGVDKLHEYIADKDRYTSYFATKINPKQFLQVVEYRKASFTEYGLVVDDGILDEYLENLNVDSLADMKLYPFIKDEVDIPRYKNKVKEMLSANISNIQLANKMLSRIKEIEEDERPMSISNYLNDDDVYSLLTSLTDGDEMYPDALAMAISIYINANRNVRVCLQNIENPMSEELLEKIASCIEYYMSYGDILLNLDNFTSIPFVFDVARRLTLKKYCSSKINIKCVLKKYESIHEDLEISSQEYLKRFDDLGTHYSSVKTDDIPSLPIKLFEDLKDNSDLQISKYCLGLAREYLKSLSQEAWVSALVKGDFNYNLLNVYHPDLLQLFVDAFKECMHSYAIGETDEAISKAIVLNTIGILNDMDYDVSIVFKEVRDVFVNNSCINKEKFKYYGECLFKHGELQESRQALDKILRSEYLDDEDAVKLLCDNKGIVKQMVNNSENSLDFKNKLKVLAETSFKTNKSFVAFCKELGILIEEIE